MSGSRARWLNAATSVLLLAAVGLAVAWFVIGDKTGASAQDRARSNALAAAQQAAVNFTSFDYTKLDGQFAVVSSELTGNILADFNKTKETIKSQFTKLKTTSVAKVLDAGSVSGDAGASQVVVSLLVTYTQGGKSTAQQSSLSMHLVRAGDRWLVDQISTVL